MLMSSEPIFICYCGSQRAEHLFHAAAALLAGRTAIVADIGPVFTGIEADAAVTPEINIALLEQENLTGAMERAEQGAELARRAGFDAEGRAELSAPTREGIVDLANEIEAAVIVIGSRGLTGVRERLEGSCSHRVTEHSRRPVVIVTPPDEHR
jgi:nucleotide-binding universal stress UspA family protein